MAEEKLELSKRDSEDFVEALLDPPEPNEALKEAARVHDRFIKAEEAWCNIRKTELFCDLCGEEIPENTDSKAWQYNEYNVDIGQLEGGSEYELRYDLCKDCAEKIYEVLADFDWENE